MDAVGLGSLLAKTTHAVTLVVVEVALEPVPATGLLVSALPSQDVRGNSVEEPTVVRSDDRAAGEGE